MSECLDSSSLTVPICIRHHLQHQHARPLGFRFCFGAINASWDELRLFSAAIIRIPLFSADSSHPSWTIQSSCPYIPSTISALDGCLYYWFSLSKVIRTNLVINGFILIVPFSFLYFCSFVPNKLKFSIPTFLNAVGFTLFNLFDLCVFLHFSIFHSCVPNVPSIYK